MIVGTGVDITEVTRIKAAMERFGDRFLRRVFTSEEVRYALGKANAAERLAARFAAKEAAMKAIGTGLRHGITWHDVEVIRLPGRRPKRVIPRSSSIDAAPGPLKPRSIDADVRTHASTRGFARTSTGFGHSQIAVSTSPSRATGT